MLKKLTALSLSLLICLSILPSQAGAMDAAEDEPGVRAEEQISPEDADAGIAPWRMDCQDILGGNAGGEPGDGVPPAVPIKKGNRVTGSRISLNLCRSYFKIRCGNYHFVEYNLNTETAAGLLCSVAVSGA